MPPAFESRPRVSILLPTYNYARFLPEAIESIWAQSFKDFELIIADDNSPDSSDEVIKAYAAADPRIRYQRHTQNLGMVANWNWCLTQARGEFIKYIFGDDCFASENALASFVALMDSYPSASIAASARLTIDEKSEVDGIWDELKADGPINGRELINQCLYYSSNLIGEPSVVMFRRSSMKRGFDPKFRQIVDLEMWFHLLTAGDLAYTNRPLCCFRRHGSQQTEVNKASQAGHTEMVGILREYLPILEQGDAGHQISRLAKNRIIFRTLLLLGKKESIQPELVVALEGLRTQISSPWRLLCWFLYRINRHLENFNHSIRKRRSRRHLSSVAAKEIAFLKAIRTKSAAVTA